MICEKVEKELKKVLNNKPKDSTCIYLNGFNESILVALILMNISGFHWLIE